MRVGRKSLPVGFLGSDHDSLLWAGEVGNAAKMMLIVNMVQGSFMATIAEGLTLAQVTGQSQQTLLDILNQGQLASIFLDQKCQSKLPLASLLALYFLLELRNCVRQLSEQSVLQVLAGYERYPLSSQSMPSGREGPDTQWMGFEGTGWDLVSGVPEGDRNASR